MVLAYISSSLPRAVSVVGCLTEAQVADSMSAADLTLTKEQCDWLYGG